MIRYASILAALSAVALVGGQRHPGDRPPLSFPDAPPILQKALAAAPKLRYVGKRVVEFRRDGQIARHEETIIRDGSFIRIEFPGGSPMSGQIIVENARERRHYFPDRNEIHILPPRRDETFVRLGRMFRGGRGRPVLTTAPGPAIAGLHTEQVVISDKDGNVLQRIYIEPNSGLILKRTFFDQVGTPVGGSEYTQVDLTPHINRAVFRIVRKGAKILTPADLLERLAKSTGFAAVALPVSSGFRLEGSFVRKIAGNDVLLETYASNSGSRLTLFQLKTVISPDRLSDFARRDNLKSVTWQANGSTFVLVGNVDEATLLKIARPISGGTATLGR